MSAGAKTRRCIDPNISQLPHIFLETYTEDFAFWLRVANEAIGIFHFDPAFHFCVDSSINRLYLSEE